MTETWMPVSGTFREYPLVVKEMGGWDYSCLYSKGHHDKDAFRVCALDSWIYENTSGDEFDPPAPELRVGDVRHEWWATRCMEPLDGCTYYTNPVQPYERGAYPVTVIDL